MANVSLKHVYKIYDGGVTAVTDFNLEIADKEFIILVGPSGCGKSTTLRMIAGLEDISKGELYIGDMLANDVAPKDRDIAMVFQNYALYPHMTVYDNMAFGLKLRKTPKEEIKRRVEEAARILGIEQYLDRKPKALSGGQRQRVALGRAIVRNPKVFLLDEPLSNLDAKLRESMRFEIKAIQRKLGISVVYVTHDQVEAMTMSDKVVVINDGIIQQVGPPMEIYRHPANQFVAAFVGKIDFIKGEAADGRINITGTDQYIDYDGELTGKVVVAIRPESIHLCKEGGKLHGVLDNKTFMGDVNDCYMRLPNGKGVRIIAPPETYDDYEIGEPIGINFDTFHVYEDDGTDAATKIVT